MGSAGAGIFISLPPAKLVDDNYQHCKENFDTAAGDVQLMESIYDLSPETKLTNIRDLHQTDVQGDLSGIFESGRLQKTLHHRKGGYDIPLMHRVTDVCGNCFLQRWQFKQDMVLSNGYPIAHYPEGDLKDVNLHRMEETWNEPPTVEASNNRGVDHSLGPTRPSLALNKRKIQYVLIDSAVIERGIRQSYLRPGVDGDNDALLELFWMKGAENGGGGPGS